jgi:hypothetical protein
LNETEVWLTFVGLIIADRPVTKAPSTTRRPIARFRKYPLSVARKLADRVKVLDIYVAWSVKVGALTFPFGLKFFHVSSIKSRLKTFTGGSRSGLFEKMVLAAAGIERKPNAPGKAYLLHLLVLSSPTLNDVVD